MIQPALKRRQFLSASIGVFTFPLSSLYGDGATPEKEIFPRPFAGSRTISNFAHTILYNDHTPPALAQAIEAELARTNVPAESIATEQYQAEFFACLALRVIAPFSLRCVGYEELAASCENARGFKSGEAAACARYDIGGKYHGIMPLLAQNAYGASDHAATLFFFARDGHVWEAGEQFAFTLRDAFSGENEHVPEASLMWNFAVEAINAMTNPSKLAFKRQIISEGMEGLEHSYPWHPQASA